MSTGTLTPSGYDLGPMLVSELPPSPGGSRRSSTCARFCRTLARRRGARRFERALRIATPSEQSDLLAAARRR